MKKVFLASLVFSSIISVQTQADVIPDCTQTVLTSFIRSEVSVSVVNEPYVNGATDLLAEIFLFGDWWVDGVQQGSIQDDTTDSSPITITGTAPNQIMNGSVAVGINATRWGNYPINTLPLTWDVLKADGQFYGKIFGSFVHYPAYDQTCEDVYSTE